MPIFPKNPYSFFALFFGIALGTMAVQAYHDSIEDGHLRQRGVWGKADVIYVSEMRSKTGELECYDLRVDIRVGSRTQRTDVYVDPTKFNHAGRPKTVPVIYDPQEPQNAASEVPANLRNGDIAVVVGLVAIGLTLSALANWRPKMG